MRRFRPLHLILIPAVWLFSRQAFQWLSRSFESSTIIDVSAFLICSLFLIFSAISLAPSSLRRIVPGLIVLIAGSFTLRLSASSPEHVLWLDSLRLLVSRISPLVGLLTIVAAWRPKANVEVLLAPVRRWMSLPRATYVLGASLLAFAATFLMVRFGYTCMPRSYDGIANIFQAMIFASGRLTLPPPPHPTAFLNFGVIQEPGWCSHYPPGYSAVLSIGLLLGSAWLVNPILTALSVPAIERIAHRFFGKPTASLSVLIFALSPFVPIVGASFRNHALSLFLLAWSTALFLDSPRRRNMIVLSGFVGGMALLTRPYTAFLWYSGLFLGAGLHRPKLIWQKLWPFALGAIPGLIASILYNLLQTGGSLAPPPVHLYGEEFGLGFGPRILGDHTFLRAISFTTTRLEGIGRMILGWPFPVVLLPIAVAILGGWRSALKTRLWPVLLPPVCLLLGYASFWHLEFVHGPRFIYSALITLAPLIAHSMYILPRKIHNILPSGQQESVRPMLAAAVLLSVLYSLILTWPTVINIYGDHYGCQVDLLDLAKTLPPGEKLIFFSPISPTTPDYGWGFLLNDPGLDGEFVVAIDGGAEQNSEIMGLFPNRQVYYYSYDRAERKGSLMGGEKVSSH